MLAARLAHPLTRNLDIDDPATTALREQIILQKPFLRRIYQEWYAKEIAALPNVPGRIIELGSGGGFLRSLIPDLITSEVFHCPNVSAVFDACALPFPDRSLRAIVMVDVLHHVPAPRRFFAEADRCLVPGGAILMVEPWVSRWSKFIYTNLHHEPFQPEATDWSFPSTGPLSGANGALPWMIFDRDRKQFEQEFPGLQIREIAPFMPFRYLVSGGVATRNLMPDFLYPAWKRFDEFLSHWSDTWPMFAFVAVERRR